MELEKLKADIEEIKNEYIQKLEEIKAKVEKLEQEIQGDEKDNRWKPKKDEDFWWVDDKGSVWSGAWLNDKTDNGVFNHTDVFPAEEEAYLDKERKQIRRELMKYSIEFECGGDNLTFMYDRKADTFNPYFSDYFKFPFALYFESEETMRKAIEEVGADRIRKYLFGAED